ncbi:hypothetical protein PaG_00401 [Moesziomyces aphidis]|uniref:Endoplasmic reticulum junction formation protein lunapark n=1 Tax=Moesziomyces aphidis TaxID=84754 RepID=W3VTK2_MOEAP|nr:hypothetical protein PaG_00401 [Moesziomyces aphidis]
MGVFNALVSGSFLPWRRANRETDYESVLARLEGEINDVQSRLTQIRLRERRASVTLTLQAFLLWAIYTAVCWFFGLLTLRRSHSDSGRTRAMLVWLPVLASPVLIISTRRIVRWWYRRIGAAEDKHLIDLRRQKREKVDEIKRATKYDHLRMLLDKYDEGGPKPAEAATPVKQKAGSKSGSPSSKQGTPPAGASTSTPPHSGNVPALSTPEAHALQAQRMALMRQQGGVGIPAPVRPAVVLQKTWMDKVADAILGADPTATGPEQKYALICARCHMHNGLALKEEFHEVQYVCPHCGHFNSRRPSSAPVSSPFNSTANRPRASDPGPAAHTVETPSKPSRTRDGGSRLKLRADESDDEDAPPHTTLQDESNPKDAVSIDSEEPKEPRRSLRARKSTQPKDGMDLDE